MVPIQWVQLSSRNNIYDTSAKAWLWDKSAVSTTVDLIQLFNSTFILVESLGQRQAVRYYSLTRTATGLACCITWLINWSALFPFDRVAMSDIDFVFSKGWRSPQKQKIPSWQCINYNSIECTILGTDLSYNCCPTEAQVSRSKWYSDRTFTLLTPLRVTFMIISD